MALFSETHFSITIPNPLLSALPRGGRVHFLARQHRVLLRFSCQVETDPRAKFWDGGQLPENLQWLRNNYEKLNEHDHPPN